MAVIGDDVAMPATSEATPQAPAETNTSGADAETAMTGATNDRSIATALSWMVLGAVGSVGGALVALLLTYSSIKDSTDDYAGLIFILTVPLGFVIGTIIAMVHAWQAERQSPSSGNLFSRTELAFSGVLLPIVTAVSIVALLG